MTRYEFLARAHEILQPKIYLEIGVQSGPSLALAEAAEVAIGIDPFPQVLPHNQRPNQRIIASTADDYFEAERKVRYSGVSYVPLRVDFVFIDGSHLFEDALHDFINVERHLRNPRSVVFFDDVLPYAQAIAERIQPPGDWTGDVWKVVETLRLHRMDLELILIDVAPTGLLMVRQAEGWRNASDWAREDKVAEMIAAKIDITEVPAHILGRHTAMDPAAVLDLLRGE